MLPGMSTPAPHVVPLFATPFGLVTLPETEALNSELGALFAARATEKWLDPQLSAGPFTFRSRDDLATWPEVPVRQAIGAILSGVTSVARSINDLTAEEFAALRVEARAWFTIVGPDGCVSPASYPNTSWLAVYCVAAPEPAKARVDSGVLRMHESRPGTMFQDATHGGIRIPYRPGHYTWRPVPGQMAVFPAAITHEIALVRGSGALVIITARVRYIASVASWMPPW
jgi:hypothetical protein